MPTCSILTRVAASGAIAAMVAGAAPIAAQEATPAMEAGAGACTAEPRDVDELVGFYFDPQGTPVATPIPEPVVAAEANLPTGAPVDAAVEAELNSVLTEIFVCFEAGQYARAFGLMTENLARQFGPDLGNPGEDTAEEVRALLEAQLIGTPVADEAQTEAGGVAAELGAGRDFRMLDGGRVGGIWTAQGESVFVVFEQQDGRWLADAFVGIEGAAAAGTPTP